MFTHTRFLYNTVFVNGKKGVITICRSKSSYGIADNTGQQNDGMGEKTVPIPEVTSPTLTCSFLPVRKLVIHWPMAGIQWAGRLWRTGFLEVWCWTPSWSPQTGSLEMSLGSQSVAGCNAVPCWLRHPLTSLPCRRTAGGPAGVLWHSAGGPTAIIQRSSWPQTSEWQTCSQSVLINIITTLVSNIITTLFTNIITTLFTYIWPWCFDWLGYTVHKTLLRCWVP